MPFYNASIETTYANLKTSANGLSKREAAKRLEQYGRNALKIQRDPLWTILVEPFRNVFMLVLFIAAIVSFAHQAITAT
jgi:magnesium-transporting ATPase (P-type)